MDEREGVELIGESKEVGDGGEIRGREAVVEVDDGKDLTVQLELLPRCYRGQSETTSCRTPMARTRPKTSGARRRTK